MRRRPRASVALVVAHGAIAGSQARVAHAATSARHLGAPAAVAAAPTSEAAVARACAGVLSWARRCARSFACDAAMPLWARALPCVRRRALPGLSGDAPHVAAAPSSPRACLRSPRSQQARGGDVVGEEAHRGGGGLDTRREAKVPVVLVCRRLCLRQARRLPPRHRWLVDGRPGPAGAGARRLPLTIGPTATVPGAGVQSRFCIGMASVDLARLAGDACMGMRSPSPPPFDSSLADRGPRHIGNDRGQRLAAQYQRGGGVVDSRGGATCRVRRDGVDSWAPKAPARLCGEAAEGSKGFGMGGSRWASRQTRLPLVTHLLTALSVALWRSSS